VIIPEISIFSPNQRNGYVIFTLDCLLTCMFFRENYVKKLPTLLTGLLINIQSMKKQLVTISIITISTLILSVVVMLALAGLFSLITKPMQ
jgi:hypothetical protein